MEISTLVSLRKKKAMTDIQQWLSDRHHDYAEGVAIFARHSANKGMVRTLTKGSARFWMGKLEYEMGKLAKQCTGREMGNGAQRDNVVRVPGKDAARVSGRDAARHVSTSTSAIPEVIMSAKAEISSLYAIVDKMHRQLYDLGTGNDDKTVRARKRLLDKRRPIIQRADELYRFKEDYFALDDADAKRKTLARITEMLSAPLAQQPSANIVPTVDEAPSPSLQNHTDLELAKRKSSLRSAITKLQNMLTYQSIRKADEPSPMPDGPKREEYEAKLAARKREYTAVMNEIDKRTR